MVAVRMQVAHQQGMPRDFQDQIDLDDLKMIIARFGRLPPSVALSYLCFDNIFHRVDVVVLWIITREDGRTLRSLAPHYTLGKSLI
jgi:hypothetical protein